MLKIPFLLTLSYKTTAMLWSECTAGMNTPFNSIMFSYYLEFSEFLISLQKFSVLLESYQEMKYSQSEEIITPVRYKAE